MRNILIYILLIVIYDQKEIEHDPVLYDIVKEPKELGIENVCPEGHDDCDEYPPENPTVDDVSKVLSQHFRL